MSHPSIHATCHRRHQVTKRPRRCCMSTWPPKKHVVDALPRQSCHEMHVNGTWKLSEDAVEVCGIEGFSVELGTNGKAKLSEDMLDCRKIMELSCQLGEQVISLLHAAAACGLSRLCARFLAEGRAEKRFPAMKTGTGPPAYSNAWNSWDKILYSRLFLCQIEKRCWKFSDWTYLKRSLIFSIANCIQLQFVGLDVNERTGHQHFSPLWLGQVFSGKLCGRCRLLAQEQKSHQIGKICCRSISWMRSYTKKMF